MTIGSQIKIAKNDNLFCKVGKKVDLFLDRKQARLVNEPVKKVRSDI
jgi:hypothetical protein